MNGDWLPCNIPDGYTVPALSGTGNIFTDWKKR